MQQFIKIITFNLLFVLSALSLSAQILKPVKWSFDQKNISATEAELIFTAKIEKGWTVYSQFTSDDGPVPTALTFEGIDGASLQGPAAEKGHKKEGFDKLFEVNVIKFLDDEDFVMTQKVKVTDPTKPISGYLTYMTCNDKTCLPPTDVDFSFDMSTLSAGSSTTNTTTTSSDQSSSVQSSTQPTQVENTQVVASKPQDIKTETPQATTSSATNNSTTQPSKSIPIAQVKFADENKAESMEEDNGDQEGILKPVKWQITKEKIADGEYELIYKASIEKGWAVYSQYMEEGGPVPTTITYENAEGVEFIGKSIEEGHKKVGKDPLFDEVDEVIKFLDDEDFVIKQKIKVLDPNKPFTGYLNYMTCNDKTCLPPTDVDFDFGFGSLNSGGVVASIGADGKLDQTRPQIKSTFKTPLTDCGKEEGKNTESLLWLLFAGILGGFAALLTPCVFPMIPITVSFFTKDTKRKGWVNGLIYGASIIFIYVVLGLIITLTLGPAALQALSTNWIANTIFFLIFMFFAFSFFGYYELTLPASWSTKSDAMADKGGLLGIFFMAATLALVSFSCTGPIVGSALVAAAKGGFVGPLVVMFGFALALALPFGLFAAFPAWLNSLPKSGGWMNSVKVVLGFLEVGFAFKFLSTADLTEHWGFLKYEIFLGILIAVAFAISIYLFGFIKFPHDSPIKKLSTPRKVLATVFAALGIYLATGFMVNKDTGIYKSLALTSGFTPPVMYNLFLEKELPDPAIKAIYPSFSKCANNIDCFKDYYEGMAYAKEQGKPVFIDFTGHGCQNCRRTEDMIWVDGKIRNILNDDVVLISLYTDDREVLPETLISAMSGEKIRNVGKQWSDFQVVNFEQNSQPLYIMMTTEEEVVTHPRGYEDGIKSYQEYLDCGLDYFKKGK